MKRTLSLLALIAALMPLSPLTAEGETRIVTVKGVTIDAENIGNSTGFFDSEKDWDIDHLLCWAAASSNLVAWWQSQNPDCVPENTPDTHADIWDTYRYNFKNKGGDIGQGVKWWFDGDRGTSVAGKELYLRETGRIPSDGGYYTSTLVGGDVAAGNIVTLNPKSCSSASDFSTKLVNYIERGYGVGVDFTTGPSSGHAMTVWGVAYDDATQLVTTLYLADSDDHSANALRVMPVKPYELSWEKGVYTTLAQADSSIAYPIISFTLVNSTFSNMTSMFNTYDAESRTITMKQNVNGTGYVLSEGENDVEVVVYDGSRGYQNRTLKVEGDNSIKKIDVGATQGVNTLEIQHGSTLEVDMLSGPGTLTKTGDGLLLLHNSSNSRLEILGGDILNNGALGEVTMANGARLVNQGSGTAKSLTIGNGCTAEVKHVFNSKAFEQATVSEGGTLKGSGHFGKVVLKGGTLMVGNSPGLQKYSDNLAVYQSELIFSIDDAAIWTHRSTEDKDGWNSRTYSTVNMGMNNLTMEDAEFTFALGKNILDRASGGDICQAIGHTLTLNLDLELFSAISNINDFYPLLDGFAQNTRFILSEDDEALLAKGLIAEFSPQNLKYYISGNALYMQTGLNVTLAESPKAPEPSTCTLSLLALAALAARRRRK